MGLSQFASYTFFGLLTPKLLIFGIALGLGATCGNILGKKLLGQISSRLFRQFLIALMVVSGIYLIIKMLH